MFSYTVIYEKGNVFAAVCVPVHCLGGGGGGGEGGRILSGVILWGDNIHYNTGNTLYTIISRC